ncbi:hypothetical protein [Diaphorobacter aerolatus]|uniref:Uncharacterized protein n=1 Tax=Diaphorobacter aerolatus TaxID=1288495 RepID=A0A7H0GNS7_9BURK|nr:hypothetical protein [Diaphorobacter aerolatus]QNP49943.1 hypothetical protein H9K75_08830 [Diaphorobacter aerolatus]
MKRLISFIWLFGTLAFGSVSNAQDDVGLKQGMRISKARAVVLRQGWLPNPSKHSRESPMWGLQKRIYQQGFKEIDQCAVDRPVCLLKYKKDKACLELEIEGEKAGSMRVIGWSHACEPDS